MILKMQKLTLIGFLANKESILRDLMKKKCVQINGPENIQDYESIAQLAVPGVAQTYELEQELTKFTSALLMRKKAVHFPKRKSLIFLRCWTRKSTARPLLCAMKSIPS